MADQVCPYLGSFWDDSVHCSVPDAENRCHARETWGLLRRLLRREWQGVIVALSHQETVCYGDFRQCARYQEEKRQSSDGDQVQDD